MGCDYCDYEGDALIVYESDTATVCKRCWPKVGAQVEARDRRNAELGHDPTSDLCGCDKCATYADQGKFGRFP